jgi:replicative DNA helicase
VETTTDQKLRLNFENAATLLAKPEPKLEWLIENMWVDKSRGLIAGNPGVGKTWLALDMLIAVASGQLCLRKYPVKQAPVLLMEEEASELNLSRRLHSMARARGLKDTDLTNLFLVTRQFAKMPRDTKELYHFIVSEGISLVVFDSLRRFHSADENSSSEMQAVLDSFGTLNAMSGASIILIHHLSKANEMHSKPLFERLRGSSDLWAWRDCILGVEGEEEASDCMCSFQFRDAEAQSPIRIKRSVHETTGAVTIEATGIEEAEDFIEKADLMLNYMRSQYGPISKDIICSKAGGRKQENLRIFKVMASKHMVVKDGSKWIVPQAYGTNGNGGND